MDWAKFTAQLSGEETPYIAIGIGLFLFALFLRWKKDWWIGFRAYITLASGILMLPLLWMALAALIANPNPKDTGFVQWLFQLAADGSAAWTNPFGKFAHFVCVGLGHDWLAYIFAVLIFFWLLHDLCPRPWNLRNGGNTTSTGSGVSGGRVKTVGDRLASITAAEPHTTWIAWIGPAVIMLVPPLAAALGMSVGG